MVVGKPDQVLELKRGHDRVRHSGLVFLELVSVQKTEGGRRDGWMRVNSKQDENRWRWKKDGI